MPSCRQVDRDLDFLEQERIMDYSMLVGLHFQSCKDSLTPSRTSSFCTPKGYITCPRCIFVNIFSIRIFYE